MADQDESNFKDTYTPTGETLGHGALASVHTYTRADSPLEFAVKVIPLSPDKTKKDRHIEDICKEVSLFGRVDDSKNILKLHACYVEDSVCYMVFDKFSYGDLFKYLNNHTEYSQNHCR